MTAFVAGVMLALFVMGGLAIDGGYALAARRRAISEANEAARAGAQAVDLAEYRSTGAFDLDPVAAMAAVPPAGWSLVQRSRSDPSGVDP